MPYHIDYSAIELEKFKQKLKKSDLVPSRRLLQDNTDEHFRKIAACSVKTAEELLNKIKTKSKISTFSYESGIEEEYLTILSREIRSTIPKPIKLTEFYELDPSLSGKLKEMGITNSKQLWEIAIDQEGYGELVKSLGDEESLKKLILLCDLARVRWVNHTFAIILHKASVFNVHQLQQADYIALHAKVTELNRKHEWYKASIGLNDFKLVIEAARDLSVELELNP